MDSIEPRRGKNWLALHENDQVRELMLQMSAQGISDAQIAVYMTASELAGNVEPQDVAYYKTANATEIVSYAQKHADKIIGKSLRAQKGYRIGELDRLLGLFAESIPELIQSKPNMAAQLMKTYISGLDHLGKETGELQGSTEQKNTWIEMLQNANAEEKVEIMEHLASLDRLQRNLKKRLPEAIIEGEFESEEV